MHHAHQKSIGCSVHRRENARLVTGQGCFVADKGHENALHLHFVRSPVSHGRIVACEVGAAGSQAGVHAVFTGTDVRHLGRLSVNPVLPINGHPEFPVLAQEYVDAVGQPVAVVLADTPGDAVDAADSVHVEIDDTVPHDRADVQVAGSWNKGDVERVFEEAAHIVSAVVHHPRLAPSPMEPRGIAVDYHPDTERVTVWYSTQTPHRARTELAAIFSIEAARIDVVAPDVGGAFGMKASLFPEEVMAVWAALHLRRSTRWVASRSEDFLAASHGRGARCEGQLAVAEDGRFLALRARIDSPLGHWLPSSAAIPAWNAGRILPCGYLVEAVDIVSKAHMSHTAPVGIYRGAGRPEANCLMERLVDCAAEKTGLDPLEIRMRNLVPEERFPYATPTGYVLDSGRYAASLKALRKHADYDGLADMCRKRRQRGEIVGLGLGFYVEPCGTGWESARVTLNPDATALLSTGGSSQGHGRETAFAQIAADTLSIPLDAVRVMHGSTLQCPNGIGALASRSTAIGGSAVRQACLDVLDRVRSGDASQSHTAEIVYTAESEAWGSGCYLIVLRIDPDTGVPTIEHAHCIDDAGTIINPAMVDGQIKGGFAQGLGEALMENVVYDDNGQLVTGSLMDYALPRACDVPALSIMKMTTPSPGNILGAKGVGEAGTIGAPAAIFNAAHDALRPFGVETLQMPLTSEQLWRAISSEATGQNR